ncbi:MAG: hypothetical protein CM15mP74_17120 [Halieaceae bacterium]|nr:MAG: hypothetical protein CM15mP74_17120 [Halieaceae bacterium]
MEKREGLVSLGKDFFSSIFPGEKEGRETPIFYTRATPKVVGGVTSPCKSVGVALYEALIDVVPVSSPAVGETKLLENIHRAVNIGLVNEMKIVAINGVDIFEVIELQKTQNPSGLQLLSGARGRRSLTDRPLF